MGSPILGLKGQGGTGWGVRVKCTSREELQRQTGSSQRVGNLVGKRETAKHIRRWKEERLQRSGESHKLDFKAGKAAQRRQHLSGA